MEPGKPPKPVDDDMNYKQSGLSWHKPIWKKLQRKMCQKEVFIPRSPQGQAV
ncbi:hypothetical protein C1H46_043825 [Malus baccata]|uniref:Uncharacterized protein n=1 Tax=Malus baccata TaxID=106549 RepID=A0A540K8T3_MALBA|nr:hypothetical protein C1H46_043825 [Malus baccata]